MAQIPLSHDEALDLLHKWAHENRVFDVSLVADGVVVKIPARLDDVNPGTVRLSLTKSTFSAGAHTVVSISLLDCTFEYCDADHAPEPTRSQLKGYDALLYVHREGVIISLAIVPLGELAQL